MPAIATPRHEHALFGLDTEPPGFDPQRWWNSATYCGTANIFEQLISIDPATAELRPQLAMTVPIPTRGGTLYTFPLRRGVHFHDGCELTSTDVKASLERLTRPQTRAETGALFASLPIRGMSEVANERSSTLKGVGAPDPYTVTIELDQPDRALLPLLSYPSAAILSCNQTDTAVGQLNWFPIGTGPYVMSDATPGVGATLRRNRDHWRTQAPIDTIRFEFNVPQAKSVERIIDGAQDFMYEPLPAAVTQQLKADQALTTQIYISEEDCCYFLTLPVAHQAFGKPAVRRAIGSAVNRATLVDSVDGLATEATGGIFSPLNPYHSPGLADNYNPDRAQQLLREAGFVNGINVDLLTNNLFPEREISRAVRDELARVGVRTRITELRYNDKAAASLETQSSLTVCDWHLSVPHGSYLVDSGFTRAAIRRGCCNYSNWTSEHLEHLAKRGHTAKDRTEELETYRAIDRLVVKEEAIWIPLVYSKRVDLVSRRVRGFSQARYPSALIKFFADYALDRHDGRSGHKHT